MMVDFDAKGRLAAGELLRNFVGLDAMQSHLVGRDERHLMILAKIQGLVNNQKVVCLSSLVVVD